MTVVNSIALPKSDKEVLRWQHQLNKSIEFKERFTRQEMWNDYRDMYRMLRWSNDTVVQSGFPFAYVRSMTPQIYLRNPKVSITPRQGDDLKKVLQARVLQRIDNWLIKEMLLKTQYRKMIQDNFFCGFGAGIIGYDSFHGTNSKFMDDEGQMSLTQFDSKGNRIEFFTSIKSGMPWFKRILPEDIVFPAKTSDPDELEWFAYRVWRRYRDVVADKKYSNVKDVPTMSSKRSNKERYLGEDPTTIGEFDKDDEWVELWHIHDARTGRVYTIVDGHPKFLRNEPDELQIEGLPIELLVFNDDPTEIYGVPDMRVIEPQILELNDTKTQAQKHRRLAVLKFLYRRGVISDDELRKLTDETVGAGAAIDSETASLSDIVMPFSAPIGGILQDMAFQADQIKGDLRESVGFSRTASGEFMGKTHISATETSAVMRALDVRLDDRRNILADSFERVIRKINQIILSRWTQDRVVDIIGPNGAKYWVEVNPSELVLEYDINVTVYDAPPLDKETKLRMAIQAAEAYARLNQGKIQQGAPIPMQLQRLIFDQFEETGLDVEGLLQESSQIDQALNSQPQSIDALVQAFSQRTQ